MGPDQDRSQVPQLWRILTRNAVVSVFVLALVLRLFVAVFLSDSFSGSLILDDGTYETMAMDKAAGSTAHWDPFTHGLYKRTGTLLVPLTYLYKLFGSTHLVGQIFLGLVGACAAALVTLLAARVTSRDRAMAAGIAMAALPSLVLWSSVVLKDGLVWLLLVVMAILVAALGKGTSRDTYLCLAGSALCLALLGFLRIPSVIIAAWAMALAVWIPRGSRSPVVRGSALVMLALVPWLLGLGVAGGTVIRGAETLDDQRARLAEGAESAIVTPISERTPSTGGTTVVNGTPYPGGSGTTGATPGVTPTSGSQPPPPPPPPPGTTEDALTVNLRHLPRGLWTILVEPVPWRDTESRSMTYAKMETVLWYPLLALAVLGAPVALRRLDIFAFPLLTLGATVLAYSLAEGNIGGAYRHRSEFVWTICLLASLAFTKLKGSETADQPDVNPGTTMKEGSRS